jgi:glutamate/tyrosine decarboxylase-like PLP-dependent enzyme
MEANSANTSDEQRLLLEAARRACDYLSQLKERRPFPSADALEQLQNLAESLPLTPDNPFEILRQLDEFGSPGTVANGGGRYFGFVTGGTLPVARAASVLAAAWDQNVALRLLSPVGAFLEDICLAWVRELLGLPAMTGGALVTCATMASFTCLAAARHHLLANLGWNVESDGLFGAPEIPVFASADCHIAVLKALGLLGLGRSRVTRLTTDDQSRIRASELPEIKQPSIVCIQAGDVNTGALDPAAELCEWAHASESWVHVDGAFGLWVAASPDRAHLAAGFSEADSWATDCHKWLNVPYDSGVAFVSRPGALRAAMASDGAYFHLTEAREPSHYNPELSRRARAIEIWAAIRSLGKAGIAELIDRTCRYAQLFAERLRAAGFEILNEVVTNQVLVSFGSDAHTDAVVQALQTEGTCWCGSTVWKGRRAMRISVSSWATTAEDVEASARAMLRVERDVRGASTLKRSIS